MAMKPHPHPLVLQTQPLNCTISLRNPANPLLSPEFRVPATSKSRALSINLSKIGSFSAPINITPPKSSLSDSAISRISNDQSQDTIAELKRDTEATLEWPSVCLQVAAFASTAAGRALCRDGAMPVGRNRRESQILLDQTAAAAMLPERLDFSGVDDVSGVVRLAAAGEMLGIRELCSVEQSLRAARSVFERLEQVSSVGGYPHRYSPLLDILRDCNFLMELVGKIDFCIDCNLSIVMDRASRKLESIRLERRRNIENLESLLKDVSMKVVQAGGMDSPLVTRRRSRMCVGIKASHKSMLPGGIVLGISSSGATYFMEPRNAVELNNMEVRLSNSERAEELAILCLLTLEIAGSEAKIKHLMERIVELDLACARGAHAKWMDGVYPVFNEDDGRVGLHRNGKLLSVDIESIHHPLLLEPSLRSLPFASTSDAESYTLKRRDGVMGSEKLREVETPVPLDIRIGHNTKVVVISGPNTGGKTASMKTLGLASLMSKSGMFLPAKGEPRLPWFDQIFADIGDHQSLEHNLSTFSGHISHICKIIEVASKESLVLIDEIGSGTDPSEGVALSTSILQHLSRCVNLAVVTTHYADLSLLHATDHRFENAAMEFCMETLQPTYRILWGSTGNSNALSIAKSIGFDQKVLDRAQEWVNRLLPDKQKERQGVLYQSLLEERNLLEAQAREAAIVLSEAKTLHLEIHSEAEDLHEREVALKAKESQLVQQEIKIVKTQMEALIKDFEDKLQNATPEQFNSIMRGSQAAISSIVAAHRANEDKLSVETDGHSSYVPQIGDKVYVKALGSKLASVVEVPGEDGTAIVQYGKIRVHVKKKDMKLIQSNMKDTSKGSGSYLKQQGERRRQKGFLEASKEFGPAVRISRNTVDLRGKRVEEASLFLQNAISGCRSYGVLFVVHGVGTGAVKECALDILRKHPRVDKFEEESPMNYGCTVAYIK